MLRGDEKGSIPYFTRFGQKPLPELLAALAQSLVAQPISDAYWAVSNPLDRLTGKGRAADSQMAFPLGGRYAPRTKGLTAETLEHGDPLVRWTGDPDRFEKKDSYGRGRRKAAYNLRNEEGDIVASADRQRYPGPGRRNEAYVPEMWVREDYRKTPAMFDLYRLLSRQGRDTLEASFANKRLERVFKKRMAREGKLSKRYEDNYDSAIDDLDDLDLPEVGLQHEPISKAMELMETDPMRALELADQIPGAAQRYPSSYRVLQERARIARTPGLREARESLNIDPFGLSAAERAEQQAQRYRPTMVGETLRQMNRPASRNTRSDTEVMASLGLHGRPPARQVTNRDVPSVRQMAPVRRSQPLTRPLNPARTREAVSDARIGTIQREVEALERFGRRNAALLRALRRNLDV